MLLVHVLSILSGLAFNKQAQGEISPFDEDKGYRTVHLLGTIKHVKLASFVSALGNIIHNQSNVF